MGRVIGILVVALAVGLAAPAPEASANVIVAWNEVAAQNMSGPSPLPTSREFAVLHVALYDAVVSITGDHAPYAFAVPAPAGASPEAAAARSGRDVLVAFHPGASAAIDARYAEFLAAIPDGQGKRDGIAVGQKVAAAVLAARARDGFNAPAPTIVDGTRPYEWRRTAPSPPPLMPQFAAVTPWVIEEAAQFLPEPPPRLKSHSYTRDFKEVKELGAIDSETRPPAGTDLALFHLLAHPVFWNDVARQLWAEKPSGLSRTARIFAVLNAATMDSFVGVWYAKWNVYFNWRPLTAIQLADTDGNPHTDPNPAWAPLSGSPMHPTYPSGHAVCAGASARVLRHFFGGGGHSLTLTSPTAPGVVLHYSRLRDVVKDVHDARVYLGVHFRFDVEAADRLGRRTARFVLRHAFRPLHHDAAEAEQEPEEE